MGTLHYGASRTSIQMTDRALAHLQVVITTKLRRGEGFLVHWERSVDNGSGRGGLWIHPNVDLSFDYDGGREPSLDHDELDRMMMAAAANGGLRITAETESWDIKRATEAPGRERAA